MRDFLCSICTFCSAKLIFYLYWIRDSFDVSVTFVKVTEEFLQIILRGRPFYWPLRYKGDENTRRLIILANGPSLQEDLERLKKENTSDVDFAMMNFSIESPLFLQYKPKYYCLADNAFFSGDYCLERTQNVYKVLNKIVDWDLTLVVSYNVKAIRDYLSINNPHIKFQRVFSQRIIDNSIWRNLFYRRGYATPGLGTVTNLAAYAGIQEGYKRIEFCGNDMSLMEGLHINDENQTCTYERHFYDKEVKSKPVMISETQGHTVDSFITMNLAMIKSHKRIAEYGKLMGVSFINRTRSSMLDCYPRLIKIHPEEFEG